MNFVGLYARLGSVLRSSVLLGDLTDCTVAPETSITTQLAFYLSGYHYILLVCCIKPLVVNIINMYAWDILIQAWNLCELSCLLWFLSPPDVCIDLLCSDDMILFQETKLILVSDCYLGFDFWLGVLSWASRQGLSALFKDQSSLCCYILYGLSNQLSFSYLNTLTQLETLANLHETKYNLRNIGTLNLQEPVSALNITGTQVTRISKHFTRHLFHECFQHYIKLVINCCLTRVVS